MQITIHFENRKELQEQVAFLVTLAAEPPKELSQQDIMDAAEKIETELNAEVEAAKPKAKTKKTNGKAKADAAPDIDSTRELMREKLMEVFATDEGKKFVQELLKQFKISNFMDLPESQVMEAWDKVRTYGE